ncbi:MAG TPA: TIGR03013 family XrtA/PEP-CTERM system glycosyltransferase [Steroidobacteraceae bacterium]|nr:TIGR03013 family XrtA/PEP-CTERM system glycosyltransferase [Steroidobacteraceae bacterium]
MAIRIFQHYWQLPLALLALIETFGFYLAPFGAAYALRRFFDTPLSDIGPIEPRGLLCAAVMFIAMAAMGLYNARQRSRLLGMLTRVAASILGGAIGLAIVFYLIPELHLGRGALLLIATLSFLQAAALRILLERLVNEEIFKRRVLVYGTGRRAASIAKLRRRSDRRGFTVVGYVTAEGDEAAVGVPESKQIKGTTDLLAICRKEEVDEIVVAMDDRRRSFPMMHLLECRLEGLEITELVSFLERETGKVRLDVLNPSWMIFSEGFRQGRINTVLERMFDIVASFLLVLITLPVMLLTAIAIKLEDGPRSAIFYRQTRVGQYGRPFRLMKFRSMREDAERDGAPQWAQKNDSRVTKVGSFIRMTRIDELPQILSVLRGEMSFVGPRPERPEFVAHLNERIPYYRERHSIKPGITGWAQLCYPYGSSEQDAAEKLQYDLFYVKNHSLLFYLAILVQTVEVIVWGKGAR